MCYIQPKFRLTYNSILLHKANISHVAVVQWRCLHQSSTLCVAGRPNQWVSSLIKAQLDKWIQSTPLVALPNIPGSFSATLEQNKISKFSLSSSSQACRPNLDRVPNPQAPKVKHLYLFIKNLSSTMLHTKEQIGGYCYSIPMLQVIGWT